ncbi:MAG: glycosyltransferase family 4 protein [Nitrospirae bacterium]|nr:glycosyltransferase family 4 protein [Nitrospirota bacterium]
MKIALIRKHYNPFGGAENYLSLVMERLQNEGHEVHIFTALWPENKAATHLINILKKPSFLSNLHFAMKAKSLLMREPFDCIMSFERTLYQDIYRAGDGCHREWLRRRGAIEPLYKRLSFFLNPHHIALLSLERQCFLNSKIIIANSMMVKKDIAKNYSLPEGKIKVIYNGVDLQRFKPASSEEKKNLKSSFKIKEDRVILFVGSDFKRKGLITLLRAFSLLVPKHRDKRLIIAGKGKIELYSSVCKRFGIDRDVTFRGPEQEVEKLYAIADVFVLPTIYDPFSNATLEAMASGLPVITTRYNGASELIENGVHGFIIDNPLDAGAFAEKISTVLQQTEEMGKKARIKVEGYSIERSVNKVIETIALAHCKA